MAARDHSWMEYFDQVKAAADAVTASIRELPAAAVVLGSGLGDFAGALTDAVSLSYGDLPYWPVSRVVGDRKSVV